jgi:GNAT superfamily N-acetyltransferase
MARVPPGNARPTLRPAKPSDGPAVARLLGELGYQCTREEAVDRIMTVLEDPSQVLLLAELHGEACGLLALDFMFYVPLGRTTCRITTLIVADSHRKLGVGRELLREAEQRARVANAARIEVTTASHRHDAHDFYRACGYSESSTRFVRRLGDA